MLFGVLCIILAFRLLLICERYSVNILFWDHWDLYGILFAGKSPWEMFLHQHGPHRQGVGAWIMALTAWSTGWNTRADSRVILGVLCLSCATALWVRRRHGPPWRMIDLAIPLLIFNTAQFWHITDAPNIAHSIFPLFLVILAAGFWTLPSPQARVSLLGITTFLATFTGFGIIMIVVMPILLLLEAAVALMERRPRNLWPPAILMVLTAGSAVLFFRHYRWMPASPPVRLEDPGFREYTEFFLLLLGRVAGLSAEYRLWMVGFGLIVVLCSGAMMAQAVLQLKHFSETGRRRLFSILFLSLFGFGFALAVTTGRIQGGYATALTGRYVTLVLPLFLALAFATAVLPRLQRGLASVALLSFLAISAFPLRDWQRNSLENLHRIKTVWKHEYLETLDIQQADRAAGFPIYPDPKRTRLEEKLHYLRQHDLNLFLDQRSP